MSESWIQWTVRRLDEFDEPDLRYTDCALEIHGRIDCAGEDAGLVFAHYVHAEDPASDEAFFSLWDLDGLLCHVYEEISDADRVDLLDPIPDYLDPAPGILCVHHIALRPQFRGMGIGKAVMRQLVYTFADARTGLVLLDATPLQHVSSGEDEFCDVAEELPQNSKSDDREALMRYFGTWGMDRLPGTRFMIAAPEVLRERRAPQWPPCPVIDMWNSCIVCGEWVDVEGGEGEKTGDGAIHHSCR